MTNALDTPIARHVWDQRYRDPAHEASIEDTWRRIAAAVARAEPGDRVTWRARFAALLDDFRFLPGGRIQAGSCSTVSSWGRSRIRSTAFLARCARAR
jgi:ribonucleoside-diphosphate reductase alpha chain